MDTKVKIKNTDVVILCGGLGTRLKTLLPDRPKTLAPFGNRTFLDILLEDLTNNGYRKFIFCISFLKDQVIDHCQKFYPDYQISFSIEQAPLGTGGAIKSARNLITSDPFLVVNGDSICRINHLDLLNFHQKQNSLLTISLSQPGARIDAGNVLINKKQEIIHYKEKQGILQKSLINAGVYLMSRQIFQFFPKQQVFSLENDLFPNLINKKSYGFLAESDVIDIGTVERFYEAQKHL